MFELSGKKLTMFFEMPDGEIFAGDAWHSDVSWNLDLSFAYDSLGPNQLRPSRGWEVTFLGDGPLFCVKANLITRLAMFLLQHYCIRDKTRV